MDPDLFAGLAAFFGVVVGANLQYLFTTRAERVKQFAELRAEAYVDFLKAAAELAISQRWGNEEQEFMATILMTDSKSRIAIYGSKPVVDQLAVFMKEFGALTSPEANRCYVELMQRMREDAPGKAREVLDANLAEIAGINLMIE